MLQMPSTPFGVDGCVKKLRRVIGRYKFCRVLRKITLLASLSSSLAAHHVIDVTGGSGFIWANARETTALTETVEAKSRSSVYMRDTKFFALRYTHYSTSAPGFNTFGFEIGVLQTRPAAGGEWQFNRLNSSDSIVEQTNAPMASGAAPAVQATRFALHTGYNRPFANVWAIEGGGVVGFTYGKSEYSYASPYSIGSSGAYSNGSSGPGFNIAFRLALQYFAAPQMVISLEYRLQAEVFGTWFGLFPFLQRTNEINTNTGHLVLVSIGYRFGIQQAP